MIEVVIQHSKNSDGETTFQWSVWDDDEQIDRGRTTHSTAASCEENAIEYCRTALGSKPDKVSKH